MSRPARTHSSNGQRRLSLPEFPTVRARSTACKNESSLTVPHCGLPPRTPGHCSSTAICTETHAFRPTRPESGIDHRVRDHGDHRWADLLGDSTRLAVDRPVGGDSRCSATGRRRRCAGRRTDPVVVIDARPSSHVRRGQRDRRSAQPGQPWVCPADGCHWHSAWSPCYRCCCCPASYR